MFLRYFFIDHSFSYFIFNVYFVLYSLVPEPIYRINSLKRLDLSHNQITELSTLIGMQLQCRITFIILQDIMLSFMD